MRIVDIECAERIREMAGYRCEVCREPASTVHHLWSRGAGQVDLPINEICLCQTCHIKTHAGNEPTKAQLLAIVSQREGWPSDVIEEEIYRVRALDKHAEFCPVRPFAHYHRYLPARWDGRRPIQRGVSAPGQPGGGQGMATAEGRGWVRF